MENGAKPEEKSTFKFYLEKLQNFMIGKYLKINNKILKYR